MTPSLLHDENVRQALIAAIKGGMKPAQALSVMGYRSPMRYAKQLCARRGYSELLDALNAGPTKIIAEQTAELVILKLNLVEKAWRAMDRAIDSKDPKVAANNAWRVIQHLDPQSKADSGDVPADTRDYIAQKEQEYRDEMESDQNPG